MNVVNRIVVILLSLLLMLVTAITVAVPQRAFDWMSQFFAWLHDNAAAYMGSRDQWALFATGRVVIGAAIAVLCLVVLWLELRRPRRKTIRAQKLAGGESHVVVDSIAQRLAYNIDQLPDVVKVTPVINGRSRGVDVDLLLETAPEVDVPMKTEEVMQVAKEVVVERMGLRLGKVTVRIKHAPYPKE